VGSLVLAAAGLLEGRTATTHLAHHRLLERLGVTYLPQRWVEDGRFITSAGRSASLLAEPSSPADQRVSQEPPSLLGDDQVLEQVQAGMDLAFGGDAGRLGHGVDVEGSPAPALFDPAAGLAGQDLGAAEDDLRADGQAPASCSEASSRSIEA
jgi:hypothetical protein